MGGIAALVTKGDAKDAAKAQARAADQATELQKEMFDISRADQTPWREAGQTAISTLMGGPIYGPSRTEQRLTGYETRQEGGGGYEWDPSSLVMASRDGATVTDYTRPIYETVNIPGERTGFAGGMLTQGPGEFTESPGYQFRMNEGINALDRSAASRGRLRSGAQEKALLRYGQDYATNEYDMFLNRYYQSLNPWFSMAGMGQISVNAGGNQAVATGQGMGQSIMAAGNARASGYINQANQITGAMNNMGYTGGYMMGNKGWGGGGYSYSDPYAWGNNYGSAGYTNSYYPAS